MGQSVVHFEVIGKDGEGMEQIEIGLFSDPEGHVVGVVKTAE